MKKKNSQGKNIICFGNSITCGQGAQKGLDYPSLLGSMVERQVINAGVAGETTGDALKRLQKDVLENDPYLVIVELGANDYFRRLPTEQVMQNLKEIVFKIQNAGAMVALCDVSGGWSIFGIHDIYHKEVKRLAKETGSIFISRLMEGILRNPSLRVDNFHPNSKGYKIIADKIYKAIKLYL